MNACTSSKIYKCAKLVENWILLKSHYYCFMLNRKIINRQNSTLSSLGEDNVTDVDNHTSQFSVVSLTKCDNKTVNFSTILLSLSSYFFNHFQCWVWGVFKILKKKEANFLNSAPTSMEGTVQLLSAPSSRSW